MRHGLVLPVIEQTSCYGKHNAHLTGDLDEAFLFHCRIPPTSLGQKIRYDKMAECFGAVGYSAATHDDLRQALDTIQHHMGTGPYLLNVEICPTSQRRAQVSE